MSSIKAYHSHIPNHLSVPTDTVRTTLTTHSTGYRALANYDYILLASKESPPCAFYTKRKERRFLVSLNMSFLRGLLQSRASTTSADDGPTGSTRTPRLHRQRCINQWDCIKEELENEPQCAKAQCAKEQTSSVCNIKMEENISQQQFWRYCSEGRVKGEESFESNEGDYEYDTNTRTSSMDSGEWNYQEWNYENGE